MPDSYYSQEKEQDLSLQSTLTAVVEIMNYNCFLESDKFHELQLFYKELATELYNMRLQNYGYGFEVIQPVITILADKLYIYSNLYLENDVPELNTMVFKIFVENLNILFAVGLKHEMVIRGFAGVDKGIKSMASSGITARTVKKDTLVLTDMLKVFRFDEIFPDEIDQKFAPALNFQSFHASNFLRASRLLQEINAVGIYFPEETRNYPFAEVSIYCDILIETALDDHMRFVTNWADWAEKHPENFPVEQVRDSISECASMDPDFGLMWRKFSEIK